ncbi:MAG: helicase-related protein [Candidatus Anstonellaceae archaeon]
MAFLKAHIVPRAYQSAIAASALSRGNTLVVLPTGLGKTLIAFLVMAGRADKGRMVFLAPTKPLVQQHYKTFLSSCESPEENVALITGEIAPKKRAELWRRQICFSTPQSFQNDIKAGRTDASCSLCVIDEAHRSVGNYAYTFVAGECEKAGALLLGLTASPGGNKQRIQEIVDALGIRNIEIRTASDSDVAPYVMQLDVTYIRVPLGQRFSEVKRQLEMMLSDYARYLEGMGFFVPKKSKKGLVELRGKILRASDRIKYSALSYYSSVFNVVHMLELIETQGLATFLAYVKKLESRDDTKAKRRIMHDERFKTVLQLCETAVEHPKLEALLKLVKASKGEKMLIFAQYRQQVQTIVDALKGAGISSERFLGKKDGVTADEQRKTIERFRNGEFDAMVATSIGEEGLDIPSVDTVIFFEPIPSEIRSIQRRGRAGRLKAGKVFVLITTGTRDEAFFYSSKKKEENMRRIVGKMQRQFWMGGGISKAEKKKEGTTGEIVKKDERMAPSTRKGRATQSRITDF